MVAMQAGDPARNALLLSRKTLGAEPPHPQGAVLCRTMKLGLAFDIVFICL